MKSSDSRLRLSIEEACGAIENQLRRAILMEKNEILRLIAHLKSKLILLIVFQNQFQNQFL